MNKCGVENVHYTYRSHSYDFQIIMKNSIYHSLLEQNDLHDLAMKIA
jgi:hypothetical protein